MCSINYNFCIDSDIYLGWIHRHVYMDIIEITREFLLRAITDVFAERIGFENLKETSNFPNRPNDLLSVIEILKILRLEKSFPNFCKTYRNYNTIKNCLSHRFGEISEFDNTPCLTYMKLKYLVIVDGKHHEFNDPNEMIQKANQTKDEKQLAIKFKAMEKNYKNGDRIFIDNSIIFGVAYFLFQNLENILKKLSSTETQHLNEIFKSHKLFNCWKFEVKYYEE